MAQYNNYGELILALINGGDNNITADSFRGVFLDGYAKDSDNYWKNVLEQMHTEGTWLDHWFIRENDFKNNGHNINSVVKYITDNIDRDFTLEDFSSNNHWNESVQSLIDKCNEYMSFDADGDIDVNGHIFKVFDVTEADAGYKYGDNHSDRVQWVKSWENVDGDNYSEVRDVDAIVPILNSAHQTQFTRAPYGKSGDYGTPGETRGSYIIGYPDMNNDEVIDASDASYILTLKNKIPTKEDLDKINFYGTGPIDFDIAAQMVLSFYASQSTGSLEDWQAFVAEYPENKYKINKEYFGRYLRLIMPKYLRRVEVEDLDRNFWVIAQTLSILSDYIFDEDSPLKDIIKRLLDEIAQLWENILHLWVAAALVTQEERYEDIETIFIPVNNSEIQDFLKYDNFEQTEITGNNANNLLAAAQQRLSYLIEQYPNSNLVIVPEIRDKNYKHNYYAKAIYAGVLIYNRNTKEWERKPFASVVSVDLTQNLSNIGGLKENMDSYDYAQNWSGSSGPSSGIYYALLRPIVDITPTLNNDYSISVSTISINFHDVASELKSGNTIIPYSITGNISSINGLTTNSVNLPSDGNFNMTKGYYKGELISYFKVLTASFEIMIRKIWQGNVPTGRQAQVTVTGNGNTYTHTFTAPTTAEWRFNVESRDANDRTIDYTASETIVSPAPDETWSERWTRHTLNENQRQTEIYNTVSHIVVTSADFEMVKIGDFYPETFIDGTKSGIPSLSAVTTKTVSSADPYYDTDTYGIGAYVLRKASASENWGIATADQHIVFVDYNNYAQNGTIRTIEGSALTISTLNDISKNYITYLKTHTNKLGSINDNGIYATKFGTSFWVGDAGSQWSAGIVHALVYYDGTTHTSEIISNPKILDGYYTTDTNVFSRHGFSGAVSQWRRLCLRCDSLKITDIDGVRTFSMSGGQIIWYDHWNDINSSYGTASPRPYATMTLTNDGQLRFSEATATSALPGTETKLALNIKYNNSNIFFIGSTDSENRIGIDRADYSTGGPIRFTQNYNNLSLAAGTVEGQACYIR